MPADNVTHVIVRVGDAAQRGSSENCRNLVQAAGYRIPRHRGLNPIGASIAFHLSLRGVRDLADNSGYALQGAACVINILDAVTVGVGNAYYILSEAILAQ